MDAVQRLVERLKSYPELKLDVSDNRLTVFPQTSTGFAVSLEGNAPAFVVRFDGWHDEFPNEEEALACFQFGLSEQCRLRVQRRGDFPYRWTLQYQRDGEWVDDSETGLLIFPFWRKREEVFLQNRPIRLV